MTSTEYPDEGNGAAYEDDGDAHEAEYVDDGDQGETPPGEADERYLPQDEQPEQDTSEDRPE